MANTKSMLVTPGGRNPGIGCMAIKGMVSRKVSSKGGVKPTVTPTTMSAVCSCFGSAGSSPGDFSLVVAKSLNGVKGRVARSFLGGGNVSVSGMCASYNLGVFGLRRRSIRYKNDKYNYSTAMFTKCVCRGLLGGRFGGMVLMSAKTLLSPADALRGRAVPYITRTMIVRGS